jgi:hypothetical protein
MNALRKIPLNARLWVLLTAGAILVFMQLYRFNIWLLIAGMIMLLTTFFSIQAAPSAPYTASVKLKLLYAPLLMAVIGAVSGFFLYGNIVLIVATSVLAVGIYSMFIRQILLSFGELRVYRGIYAFIASAVFCIISLFMIMIWLQRSMS